MQCQRTCFFTTKTSPNNKETLTPCNDRQGVWKYISYHQVPSVRNIPPLANIEGSINGMTPFESLHVIGHGGYKDGSDVVRNLIGPGKVQEVEKESLN